MRVWLRRTLITLAVLLVLAGAAYYWLIVESHMPGDASYALDHRSRARALAAVPGDKPGAIEVEQVGVFTFPATGVVAGDGWDGVPLPVYSYRLDLSGRLDHRRHRVDARRWAAASSRASTPKPTRACRPRFRKPAQIVITHEHMDHIGGLTAHADLATVLPKARLTPRATGAPRAQPAGEISGRRARWLSTARVRPVPRARAGRRADQARRATRRAARWCTCRPRTAPSCC